MILPKATDAIHRGQLYRLLIEIADNNILTNSLIFKGGTCASMLGRLDRFSVDLDFDIQKEANIKTIKNHLEKTFKTLNLEIKDQSINSIQYVVRYEAQNNQRNSIKIDAVNHPFLSDKHLPSYLSEIDRYLICQTVETMFAHKLVAVLDRYEKHGSIAGRDIYDIHHFFISGYKYDTGIIKERTGLPVKEFLVALKSFIEQKVTGTAINEDLNTLLPSDKYQTIRKSLKFEVLNQLENEIL